MRPGRNEHPGINPTGAGYSTHLPITTDEIAECDALKLAEIDRWGYEVTERREWRARGEYHADFSIRPKWWLRLLQCIGWGVYANEPPRWFLWLRSPWG